MSLEIKIPIRDPGELVNTKAIAELPAHLDSEDAAVTRELLFVAQRAAFTHGGCTVGQVADVIGSLDPSERKSWLDGLRRLAGLPTVAEETARIAREQHVPDDRPVRVGLSPSGALIDLNDAEDQAARWRDWEASTAAQRHAEHEQSATVAAGMAEYDRARDEAMDAELPEHLRR